MTAEYRRRVEDLSIGASFGNPASFARLDRQSNLFGLWSAQDNQYYLGEWTIDFQVNGEAMTPMETTFRPDSQTTFLSARGCEGSVTFSLPVALLGEASAADPKLQLCKYAILARNRADSPATVRCRHSLTFPGVPTPLFTKQPADEQCAKQVNVTERDKGFEIVTLGKADEARFLGSDERFESWEADQRSMSAVTLWTLAPGQERGINLVFAFSPDGINAARAVGQQALVSMANEPTVSTASRAMKQYLARTELWTPDARINRAMEWAKVNALRVQHQYRAGPGFTNDPPQDIVVIRDLAWYALGSDYVTPGFSRGLYDTAERHAYHEGGKLTEYFHADEDIPEKHDYHLNINDDTPLFVYGLFHHALVCGDDRLLSAYYALMKRSCDWIISQIHDGLVRCHADGTNVWGICSWRNIIDGYNLTGAVTEINAECYHALRITSETAARMGRTEEARQLAAAADNLRDAVNRQLVSEKTGLYLLNIDSKGGRHHDVTGDLVFPLMFGVADEEMEKRIIARLLREDFWTPFGARTVVPGEPLYDPDFGYQLVGGIWPNLTAWIAYGARKSNPATVAEAMVNVYKQSDDEKPARFGNVVPGEFPERLHGTTFESRGMAMSPWMPSTYIWLAIEGLIGIIPGFDGLLVSPSFPAGWHSAAVKNLHYRKSVFDLVVHEGTIYTTSDMVRNTAPVVRGSRLEARCDNPEIFSIALLSGQEVVIWAASSAGAEGTITASRLNGGDALASHDVSLAPGASVLLRLPMGEA